MHQHQTSGVETQVMIPVGISACLTGQSVRYNGGHTQSALCLRTLSRYFTFKPFCPEVAAGFGIPRPTMRLIGEPASPRLTYSDRADVDLTEQLLTGVAAYLPDVEQLDGYILMKNSPSCGKERVKVYQPDGTLNQVRGQGLFASRLQQHYPLLPIEEEGRLHDARLQENFILRVYAHYNFRCEVLGAPSYHNLLQFHSSYKYVLMAHSQVVYRQLGRMLAESHKRPLQQVLNEYISRLMGALSRPALRKGHSNVLLHILGYLKKSVPGHARQHIVDIIHRYRHGQIPLVTPLILIKHYIEQHGSDYIRAQRYLQPYPDDLGLQNRL